jgi:hypothetical protein
LGGLYGIVTMVEALVSAYDIMEGAIEVGCNGKLALRAFDLGYYFDPQQANFDFLSAILTSVRASPLRWKYRHILGHQDLHNPGQIDHWAALNIKMDSMAKAHWQDITQHPEDRPEQYTGTLHGEGWTIWRDTFKLSCINRKYLYETIHCPKVQDWWVRHGRIPADLVQQIDWELVGPMQFACTKWLTKHASANCGVGKTLVKWGIQIDLDCPRCGKPEMTTHILQCQADGVKEQWMALTDKLWKWMRKLGTPLHIDLFFCQNCQTKSIQKDCV